VKITVKILKLKKTMIIETFDRPYFKLGMSDSIGSNFIKSRLIEARIMLAAKKSYSM